MSIRTLDLDERTIIGKKLEAFFGDINKKVRKYLMENYNGREFEKDVDRAIEIALAQTYSELTAYKSEVAKATQVPEQKDEETPHTEEETKLPEMDSTEAYELEDAPEDFNGI